MRATPRKLALTKTVVEAIKPPTEGRIYTYDAKQPGLAVCTTSAGTKTWYWYRKIDGRPERTRIGAFPQWTCDNARVEAAKLNGIRANGGNPNDASRAKKSAPTFSEFFEEFIAAPTRTKAKRPKSPRTVKEYRLQFDNYLAGWHERKITSVSRGEIERLQNTLAGESGHYVANRVVSLVKAMLNAAIDLGYASVNPAARIAMFAEESRDRFLQADELPRFWKSLEAEPSEKVRDFFKLALFTGQRRNTVATMRWADVNLVSGVWTMPHTKTGRHAVPLTAPALEILRRRHAARGDAEYVFPGRHGAGHLQDPMRQWREILIRAGIENLRIHDLRRSLGSWQAKGGASLVVIGKTMGHSRPETTAIYSRLDDDPVRKSMEAAAAAILKAATPKSPTSRKAKSKQESNVE